MATSLTHKYIPRIEQTEENLFMEEYYSSTDTKIIMDDVEQTEIGYISYSLQEQLKPLYGYASRTFDDVAIGNRIVTGAFKVPIKNPEAQTSMDKIIERSNNPNINDYNDNQQDLMDTIDWINGQNHPSDTNDEIIDDGTFEYQSKLITLGYDLDYNSSISTLKKVVKQFQKDHNIEQSGELNSWTKNAIDEALRENNKDTLMLPPGTEIYTGPEFTFPKKSLTKQQTAYVLDRGYDNNWVYIMTEDGTEGFINMMEV